MKENQLSGKILDAAIEVQRELGPGLPENVYQDALVYELRLRGINVRKEVCVPIFYKGVNVGRKPLSIDILVENCIIVECKATEQNNPVFAAQCLTYLKLTKLHLGLLINFGMARIIDGFKRIINGYVSPVSPSRLLECPPTTTNTPSKPQR